ncbi:MAG: hypothetical protein F6K31_05805 [Symploca sp. SIO2G7]|nr:hypothetical protein [Symploca sp. SIO2G7]
MEAMPDDAFNHFFTSQVPRKKRHSTQNMSTNGENILYRSWIITPKLLPVACCLLPFLTIRLIQQTLSRLYRACGLCLGWLFCFSGQWRCHWSTDRSDRMVFIAATKPEYI